MKKNILYKLFLGVALTSAFGCSKSQDPDPGKSVIKPSPFKATVFDQWLVENYVAPYNIDLKYRLDDNLLDRSKNLVPATTRNVLTLAPIIRHAWLNTYDEVAGKDFMRTFSPRVIHLIGSAAWNGNGTIVLGTAEDGLQVTLYNVNNLDLKNLSSLNDTYFQTMHHEFGHILHQQKPWPTSFNDLNRGDYIFSNALSPDYTAISIYAPLGFVTAYSRTNPEEDITEVTACYITWSDKQWEDLYKAAGDKGSEKIKKKVQIVKEYMKGSWSIDLDKLRDVVRRRTAEISSPDMKLIQDEWQPLLRSQSLRSLEQPQTTGLSWLHQHAEELYKHYRHPSPRWPLGGGGVCCQVALQSVNQ